MRQIAKRAAVPLSKVTLPDEEPWQPLRGERDAPREAFVAYYLMPTTRTLRECAELVGRPLGTISSWASEFCWLERAAAHDRANLTRHEEWIAERARRMAQRQIEEGERHEAALFGRAQANVGELDAKDTHTAWLGARKDNRIAAGIEGRGGGAGSDRSVHVNVEVVGQVDGRLEEFTARLRVALDRAGLSAEQWKVLEDGMRDPV